MKRTYRAVLQSEYLDSLLPKDDRESLPLRRIINYIYSVYCCSEEDISFDDFLKKLDDPEFEQKMFKWYEEDANKRLEALKKKEMTNLSQFQNYSNGQSKSE